ITGEWIRINFKNKSAWDERNHVNVVFLSNESMPVVLEEDDRRHAVIWTPAKLGPEFYAGVLAEIADGGIPALHDYLLHHDVGDFGPGTLPPYTDAKDTLVELSLDSTSRFYKELIAGDIAGVKARPALSTELYEFYRIWSARSGHRPAPMPRLINQLERKHGVKSVRKRYADVTGTIRGPHGVVMLGDAELPPGAAETAWLGEQIATFHKSLGVYKGESYD